MHLFTNVSGRGKMSPRRRLLLLAAMEPRVGASSAADEPDRLLAGGEHAGVNASTRPKLV